MSDKIIAIDGGAGSGKSSAAKHIAKALGWEALDTGSLYRLVAVMAASHGLAMHDEVSISDMILANSIAITGPGMVSVNSKDLSDEIRQPEVAEKASIVATLPLVRRALLPIQRNFYLKVGALVVEGRDIASVVFPDAALKIWLVASNDACKARIIMGHIRKGAQVAAAEKAAEDVLARKWRDAARSTAPWVKVEGVIEVDSTHMTEIEVCAEICSIYWLSPEFRPSKAERLSRNSPILWYDSDGVVFRRIFHHLRQ